MRKRDAEAPESGARDDVEAAYVPRGSDCAYANLRLLARAVSASYDEALRPVGLRASQLALLWAIVAREPVEAGQLAVATLTDQTTLSRTIAKLRAAGLVSVRGGADRRVRILRLTKAGHERFRAAMPLWDDAQQRAAAWLPLDELRRFARRARKAAQAPS